MSDENYLWEESFGDEKGQPRKRVTAIRENTGSFNSSAILQDMLKGLPAEQADELSEVAEGEAALIKAPLMPAMAQEQNQESTLRPTGGTVQSLLQLAEEAERQARLTAEAAETANNLAKQLLEEINQGNDSLKQLYSTAAKNAYLAAETAVRAQLSALETHAAAVNQSLVEVESSKDNLHRHSQDFIRLSKISAQAQDEAALAREKSERSRLEYASKQNAALNNRDALAQSKREYQTKLELSRFAQENLEVTQKKARQAQNEYLQLKERLEERRAQWKSVQHLSVAAPVNTQPQQQELPQQPPAPEQIPVQENIPANIPANIPVEDAAGTERRQIAALVLPTVAAAEPDIFAPDDTQAEVQEQPREKTFFRIVRTYLPVLLIAGALALCLRLFVINVVAVDGNSMLPTLSTEDRLISSKVSYIFNKPQRFDIILMDAPDGAGYYIKRIIALPNEHLQIENGQVYVDGKLLDEPFLRDTEAQTQGNINTVIPDGYYFVMGDNRLASRDSRLEDIGPIAEEHINGKAIARIFPLSKMNIL